jgi:hypothetical protein
MSGCDVPHPSDDALAIGLRQPIEDLNRAVLTPDLPRIRSAARAVIATYDAAVGPH